jgi:hypothetical protein
MKNIPFCFELLGRYVNPDNYKRFIISALRNELASFYSYTQGGALKCFGHLISGAIDLVPKEGSIEKIDNVLQEFVQAMNEVVLESLDTELTKYMLYSLTKIFDALIKKKELGLDISLVHPYLDHFYQMLIRA